MSTKHLTTCLGLVAAATAQSLSLSAPADITASATYYSSTQTQTQPSGPLPPNGSVFARTSPSAPTPSAWLAWQTFADTTELGFVGSLQCLADGAGPGFGAASVLPGQFLLELVAATPTPVTIVMQKTLQLTAGAPAPVLRVDVDDDGYFECTEFSPDGTTPRTLSPTPLRIRVVLSADVLAPAAVLAELRLRVLPDDQTTATFAVGGCDVATYTAVPTFAGDLAVTASTAPQQLAVAVFGLGWQPVVLDPGTAMPCLLLPSIDHVQLAPSGTTLVLPIPPNARPLTFWTQAVVLSTPFRLGTTAGYTVSAW
ncbi:MAG: hypothetical protein K8J09_06645 [Planctomycetes bacterium]|nr:hypothetical protein [Planctomycetota bacterium]MCC7398022.1 hypothetical protein [Planctomycetota bacterium]